MEKTKGAVQKQQVNSPGLSPFAVAFCIESFVVHSRLFAVVFAFGLYNSHQAVCCGVLRWVFTVHSRLL